MGKIKTRENAKDIKVLDKKELFRPQEKLLYNSHIQQSWVRIIL